MMVLGRYCGVKKAVSRALAGAILATCMAAAPFSAFAETVLANGHVYLRKGATTQSDILVVLAPNAELEVMDTQGEWYYVKYGSKKGYVRSDVVTVKGGTTFTGATTGYNTSVTSYRSLTKGSSGEDVLALETRLATLGFFDGEPDKKYDDATAYAVRLFQEENGLKADGVAGEKTQELLLGVIGTAGSAAGGTGTAGGAGVYRSLDLNDTGADVTALQQKLKDMGYYDGEVTGSYGKKTKEAVRQYQKKNDLGADGIAGAKTQTKLFGENTTSSGTVTGGTQTVISTTLREGSTGADVTALQQKLAALGLYKGKITGSYGNLTKEAVRQYQKKNGLGADGIAGQKTLSKIFSEATEGTTQTPSGGASDGASTDTSVTLTEGSSGVQVTALQQKLKDLGYYTGDITGSYGRLTKEAVRLYQKDKDLGADGVAGPKTLAMLNATPSTGTSGGTGNGSGTVSDESSKVSNTTLRVGSRSADVKNLQQRLKDLGYLAGSVDGVFGSATESALMTFQSSNGLSADGIAGKNTQTVLYGANAKAYSTATDSSTLKRGSQGTLVKNMQQKLKDLGYYTGSVTGNFGSITEEAVRSFQRANGLTSDGIAGVSTLNKLYAMSGSGTTGGTDNSGGSTGGQTATAPNAASVKNVNWYTAIRPKYKAGTVMQIYDFATGYTWQCVMMSNGAHADSQPRTADDTAIMYKAFGNKNTWTPKAVWITMPDGQTYIASMHNVPHLSGSIKDNNFDGHLCIHFPREMSEAEETGPYAVSHQKAIIAGWEATQKMIK